MDHAGDARFALLGPLAVTVAGRDVTPRAPHERSLLAFLLTAPGRVVSVAEIVSALWGEDPPRRAEQAVQVYVSRLRRSLGDASLIATRAPGYLVAADPKDLDAARFEAAAAAGRAALRGGEPRRAAMLLRDALGLWRGEALGGIPAPFAEAERARLDELRLGALADRIDADLALGRGPELVAELDALTARYPLRERFWGQLMTALYRGGRQGDALGAYRRLRKILVEDLGVEPGPEVRAIEAMVLAQDPRLAAPPDMADIPAPLRTAGAIMVGREAELRWLRAAFDRVREGGRAWVAVEGAHGSGRTRLVGELASYAHGCGAVIAYATGAELVVAWPAPDDRPALVVVDDVHDAPAGELKRLAEWAARALDRLLMVATYETGKLSPASADRLRLLGTEIRTLAPLGERHLADIVRLYVDESDVPTVVADSAAAGGVPLLVHRAASAWAERSAAAAVKHATTQIMGPTPGLVSARGHLVDGLVHVRQVRDQRRAQAGPGDDGRVVCPYKGLAFFDVADAEYFFGRERLVAELVARLVEAPLLAVAGPSGSGKSSVARAGLVAALQSGVLPGSDRWAYQITTPTGVGWRTGNTAIGAQSLIVIDQLEEAFTALAPPARDALVDQVLAAVRSGSRCVLAVRADYFGHLAAYPELARLVSANTVLVGAMSPDELRAAIVRPAERAGLELDDGLADALVAEVAAEPGALPLLSTALLSLWERRAGRRLTVLAYGQTGGVRAAIGRLAESAYGELGSARQAIARRILLRLASAGGGGEYVRRRAPIAELVPDGDPDERAVLDALAGARLVSVAEGYAEVAHEALLREWPRLRAWLDQDEIGRRVRAHLTPAAAEWVAGGRDPAELYRGGRLAAALEWAGDHDQDLSPTEREFLAAGRALAQAEVVRRRRSIRRLRALAAAMAVLLVLAGIAVGVAASLRARAGQAAMAADVRSLRAQAAATDRWDLALLYAVQAYRFDPSLQSRAVVFATLQRSPEAIGVIRLDSRPLHLAVSPDGMRLAAGDRVGAVYVWDAAGRNRQIKVNVTEDGLESIDFSPDGRRLAVVTGTRADDGQSNISIIDLSSPEPIPAALPGPDVAGAAFATDGATLVAFTVDGRLAYLDARTGRILRTAGGGHGPGLAIKLAPDRRFAGAGMPPGPRSGPVSVWDLERNREIWSGSGWGLAAASPDGKVAIAATGQRTLQEINLTTGVRRTLPTAHSDAVRDIAWSTDGTTFATASDDRTTVLWDRASLKPKATLVGHRARVTRAAFAPDGRTLYTTGLDGTVFVWDLDGSRRVARPAGQPPSIDAGDALRRISSHGSLAATLALDGDGGLEVTDLTGGDRYVLVGPEYAGGFDLSVDANGDRIALLTRDRETRSGYARILDVATRRLLPFAVRVDLAAADGGEHGALAISPDGRMLTIVDGSSGVQTWDIDHQTRTGDVRPNLSGTATWVGLEPTGRLMASLVIGPDGRESSIDVVDLRDGRSVAQLERIEDSYQDQPVFSPDGRLLAAGTMSGEILLWDTRTWKRLHRWRVSDGWTVSYGFTPDSRYVIAGGTDGKAGLWDVRDPTNGIVIDATSSGANYVYVGTSADGRELVTVPQFGTPLRWDIDPDSLARRACDIPRRSLTAKEWANVLPDRPYQQTCPK
jgi:DNA-binding SARP family transcriptional activator/WD40 repeat protein